MQNKIQVKSNIPTVKELRQSGHKVRVQRYRTYSTGHSLIFLDQNGARINEGLVSDPLPHGGITIVSIRKPSGEEVSGVSECSLNDSFVKIAGVEIGTAKALGLPIPQY